MDTAKKGHTAPRRKHPLPSIDTLRQTHSYDPETGEIFGPRGAPLRARDSAGYITVSIKNDDGHYLSALAHRVAYALMTGTWPNMIDHINRDKKDNRWQNLRNVTAKENSLNAPNRRFPYISKVRCKQTTWGYRWNVTVPSHKTQTSQLFCAAIAIRNRQLAAPGTVQKQPRDPGNAEHHGSYMRARRLPSIDYLRSKFHYDPETGEIFGPSGAPLQSKDAAGYINSAVKGPDGMATFRAHRLAYALMTGEWPDVIDHINNDPSDNRWCNLRNVSQAQNMKNRRPPRYRATDGTYSTRPPKVITRSTAPNAIGFRQGFGWQTMLTFGGKAHTGCYRDFCKAWKRRAKILAAREIYRDAQGYRDMTTPEENRDPRPAPVSRGRPLALWAWADQSSTR